MKSTDPAKYGMHNLAMGAGREMWCRGPPVACGSLMPKRSPGLEALRL